jgi:hypothetical protein
VFPIAIGVVQELLLISPIISGINSYLQAQQKTEWIAFRVKETAISLDALGHISEQIGVFIVTIADNLSSMAEDLKGLFIYYRF